MAGRSIATTHSTLVYCLTGVQLAITPHHLAVAFYADPLVDSISAVCSVVGGDEELSLARRGRALEITWFVGDADVVIRVEGDPLVVPPSKCLGVELGALLLLEAHTAARTGLVWAQLVLFGRAHTVGGVNVLCGAESLLQTVSFLGADPSSTGSRAGGPAAPLAPPLGKLVTSPRGLSLGLSWARSPLEEATDLELLSPVTT